jgi:hypothetical protein
VHGKSAVPDLRPACDLGFVLLAEDGSEHSFRAREREIEAWVRKTWIQHTVIAVFVAESARGIAPTNEFSAPSSLWPFEASYKGLRRALLPEGLFSLIFRTARRFRVFLTQPHHAVHLAMLLLCAG